MQTTSTAASERVPDEQTEDYARLMAAIWASRRRKAGLVGRYAEADCELGRRVFALAEGGVGAYLHGAPGRGKTYAAACAVRLALGSGMSAKLVAAADLLDAVRRGFDTGGDPLSHAERYGLLALDDLGAESPTEWARETIVRLVDARTSRGLPTVVTSNHRLGEMRDMWGGAQGARIASRLGGACEIIEVSGDDMRRRR